VLKQITFKDYKGFADFRISFGEQAFLVGPNNAGKTTIIAALRLCASLLSHAKRLRPQTPRDDNGRWVHAYNFTGSPLGFVDENVRHEFRDVEPWLELVFKNGARIKAIWPLDDTPFFYLETAPGVHPRRPTEVREAFSTIGVVPILSPIEHDEVALTADHVRESMTSRLVSRHFRNQVYLLEREQHQQFEAYVLEWTPEISGLTLRSSFTNRGRELDLFFIEATTHSERELFWAGDGLQIWLQVLYHLWRQKDVTTLVLDEPDVFLHPDMQRRLVHVIAISIPALWGVCVFVV
jgi:energy-coupling factor transporter ATP-binding protein EcfA2